MSKHQKKPQRFEIIVVEPTAQRAEWIAACEWGQEDPSSPMAAGAAYGRAATPQQAIRQVLDKIWPETRERVVVAVEDEGSEW